MMTPLLIIDMQPGFIENTTTFQIRNIILAIQNEIRRAKKRKSAIILVEYLTFGSTIEELRKSVQHYTAKYVSQKMNNDLTVDLEKNYKEIYDLLKTSKRVRVVGVNTSFCVRESVQGLHSTFSHLKIDVMAAGCANVGVDTDVSCDFSWISELERATLRQPLVLV